MEELVKRFLDEAKVKEKEVFEKEAQEKKEARDSFLVSLGLIKGTERKWQKNIGHPYVKWDQEKQMYYYDSPVPVDVNDEEFAEIQKYAKYHKSEEDTSEKAPLPYDNGAERTLNTINKIMLILAIIGGVVLFFTALGLEQYILMVWGLGVILGYVIIWAFVKVYINISNNLHEINYKLGNK